MKPSLRIAVAILTFASVGIYADDIPVKAELASALENAVKSTGSKVNISKLTPTDANINTIDGMNVCDPQAKNRVIAFQNALLQQPHVFRVYSIYFVDVRVDDGTFKQLTGDDPTVKALMGKCKDIYVSVK